MRQQGAPSRPLWPRIYVDNMSIFGGIGYHNVMLQSQRHSQDLIKDLNASMKTENKRI